MERNEIDIKTLTPDQLKPTDAERLVLNEKESITLKVTHIKAFQTDFGILWNYIGENTEGVYSFSSWGINIYPKPKAMTDLKDKLVKLTNNGNKRYRCDF
jgi:hypothetical protein